HGSRAIILVTLYCTIGLICILAGFFLGRLSKSTSLDGVLWSEGDLMQTWEPNNTFSSHPTPESEAAWQSLIPEGRGFITHPILAPHGKSIAVFHELHCLHGIQIAYYTALHNLSLHSSTYSSKDNGTSADNFLLSLGARTHLSHIQHCFDYVRQALLCAADTNLEEPDPETGKTNGWGITRRCKDYKAVVNWAEKWKNNEAHTILGAEETH
ncbi:hypothetical protein GQ43DRAFT_496994, partial [Delitschia confertaspora ATCC 74209]